MCASIMFRDIPLSVESTAVEVVTEAVVSGGSSQRILLSEDVLQGSELLETFEK